jgi:hypothetical protein
LNIASARPVTASGAARVKRNHGSGASDREGLSDVISMDGSNLGAACAEANEANQYHRQETRKPTCDPAEARAQRVVSVSDRLGRSYFGQKHPPPLCKATRRQVPVGWRTQQVENVTHFVLFDKRAHLPVHVRCRR